MTTLNSSLKNERVVVAMSGGVDSSVCAYLLKEQGYEVIGVTLKTWSSDECKDEKSKGCCSIRDIDDARSVARKLSIPYYVMDLSGDFKKKVIDIFVAEYLAGRTPNPCIECNNSIKFGLLAEKARELEASYVATGHYARMGFDENEKRFFIREGFDASKDQSYVLFGLNQEQLAKTLLPIGEMTKTEVRQIAGKLGLRVFDKPDSQEICFVRTHYADFVRNYSPEKIPGKGNLVDREGRTVGTHSGAHLFTVGQRKRIGVTNKAPYFVTQIDSRKNEVTIGFESDLFVEQMSVRRVNWQKNPRTGKVFAKIRYRHSKSEAEIVQITDTETIVKFHIPQKAVTPGQAAVFYEGDSVIGGGWIHSAPILNSALTENIPAV